MIDLIPKIVSLLFLFRIIRKPLHHVMMTLKSTTIPILGILSFLLGSFGLTGLPYVLPLAILSLGTLWRVSSFQLKSLPLIGLISLISVGTGYLISTPIPEATPVVKIFDVMTSLLADGGPSMIGTLICLNLLLLGVWLSPTLSVFVQVLYLTLLMSSQALPYGTLLTLIVIGTFLKRDIHLSLYVLESTLVVGTLYTSYPISLIFSLASFYTVWQLSRILPAEKTKVSGSEVPKPLESEIPKPTTVEIVEVKPVEPEIPKPVEPKTVEPEIPNPVETTPVEPVKQEVVQTRAPVPQYKVFEPPRPRSNFLKPVRREVPVRTRNEIMDRVLHGELPMIDSSDNSTASFPRRFPIYTEAN
jgi:hypothetical protein